MHLTGRYPDWWQGKRFFRPTRWWASGPSNETTRDNPQRILLGEGRSWGTGTIPAYCLAGKPSLARGFTDLVDTVRVRHITGGVSTLQFKAYEQGWEKWTGATLEGVWFDEEPPEPIYKEGLTRTNATKGITMLTVTPLEGMTTVIGYFHPHPKTPDRHLTMMTLDEAGHYSDEERERIIASYEDWERDARTKGIPMLGEGRIFPFDEAKLSVPAISIPQHFAQLIGVDFGDDHPFAAVHLAWDRDADTVYVCNVFKESRAPIAVHASAMKAWGGWQPVAWPHDGHVHERGGGPAQADLYRREGLRMLPEHATHLHGGFQIEPGIAAMKERMRTGRIRVFEHLEPWWQEFRVYHRKDGKVVKEQDDLMSATRIGVMSLRFARTQDPPMQATFVDRDYDPLAEAVA